MGLGGGGQHPGRVAPRRGGQARVGGERWLRGNRVEFALHQRQIDAEIGVGAKDVRVRGGSEPRALGGRIGAGPVDQFEVELFLAGGVAEVIKGQPMARDAQQQQRKAAEEKKSQAGLESHGGFL